jgi:phage virion morphogenesis protein
VDDLQRLENWVEPLLQQITPAARKKLAKEIGTQLRRSQQQRIKQQQNPDGTKYKARRAQPTGRIKRKAMFIKLKRAKHLKVKATANKVSVGFFGRVAQIANVHQKGLRDKAHKNSRDVRYSKRQLLGFTRQDKDIILNILLDHISQT